VLLGIFWVVNGTIELFTALSHSGMPQRGWTAFMGVLSILAARAGTLKNKSRRNRFRSIPMA
jgi:uncharacterized membrane protein HdeD (DUF308 family)